MKKLSIVGTAGVVLSLLVAGPVLALTPANDAFAGREIVPAVPYNATVDTTDATSDVDDAEANLACGAPITDASVWYGYTAGSDSLVLLDARASSYSAGFIVVTGTPGSFNLEACGAGEITFPASAGTTYQILIFDYQGDGGGNGGTLELSIGSAARPTLDLTVDPVGSFDPRTGAAVISGTVTCAGAGPEGEGKNFISVELSQTVGRFQVTALGGAEFDCDGAVHAWTLELVAADGKFAGGHAAVSAFTFACGEFVCDEDEVNRTVRLRR